MKLILFIGHHKVGSTALQTYLSTHALALLRRGILYPAVEGQGMAALLRHAVAGRAARRLPLPMNYREGHNALAFRMLAGFDPRAHAVPVWHPGLPPAAEMLRILRRQVEVLQPRVTILAAEVFANFGVAAPGLIDTLAASFPRAEVHLAVTLRRIDDYMVSWHAQRLNFGDRPRSLPQGAVGHYMTGIHFDYRRMLEPWLVRLPEAQLRLRGYDEVIRAGGAVRDFLDGFGIAPVRWAGAEPRLNTGLHRALIEIARRANLDLPAGPASELFAALLRDGPTLPLPAAKSVEMYGGAVRAQIAERFAPIHDWLAERAGRPLFEPPETLRQTRPLHEHAANQAALELLRGGAIARLSEAAQRYLGALTLTPNFPAGDGA